MIRNVVIHVSNEQPLLADLFDLPTASDAGLVCTNLRTMDGKRPVFIDNGDSMFFFPYLVIRFLEIQPSALERHRAEGGGTTPQVARREPAGSGAALVTAAPETGADMVAPAAEAAPADLHPVPVPAPDEMDLALDDEPDPDFLRRIRDI